MERVKNIVFIAILIVVAFVILGNRSPSPNIDTQQPVPDTTAQGVNVIVQQTYEDLQQQVQQKIEQALENVGNTTGNLPSNKAASPPKAQAQTAKNVYYLGEKLPNPYGWDIVLTRNGDMVINDGTKMARWEPDSQYPQGRGTSVYIPSSWEGVGQERAGPCSFLSRSCNAPQGSNDTCTRIYWCPSFRKSTGENISWCFSAVKSCSEGVTCPEDNGAWYVDR